MTDIKLPAHPSLEFDRKQAKRLLKSLQAGDPDAVARFTRNHPRFLGKSTIASSDILLSDALLVAAREYGFSSWPEWKHFVELSQLEKSEKLDRFLACVCSDRVGTAGRLLSLDETISGEHICAAAAAGDTRALEAFIRAGETAATAVAGPLEAEPLVYACQSRLLVTDPARREGIVECARLLLEAGANPNAAFIPDDSGEGHPQTALYGAAGIANHAGLTRLLLEAGADPNDGVKGKAGETLYHVAEFSDTTCLELVLAAGADKAALDYCLGRALDFRRPEAARLFVQYGADVDYRVSWFENRTHLMKAIRSQCEMQLIRMMVDRSADLEQADDRGFTAYRHAVRAGRGDVAELLASKGADTNKATDLDRALGACMAADEAALDEILAASPQIASRLDDADKALLPAAVRRASKGVLPLLVKLGIPIDFGEMPALHDACYVGDLEAVQELVTLGASLTTQNNHGGTALGAAIFGSTNCHDPWGGPGSKPPQAVAPRDYARIVDYLIARGAPLPARPGGSPAVIEVLQRHGVCGGEE